MPIGGVTVEDRGKGMAMSVDVVLIDDNEAWAMFDRAANRELGLSGDQFAKRWDEGGFEGHLSTEIMRVAVLRPRGR